jgi:hypothetical protein
MSLIGDVGDPKKDAAAIEPVLDELEAKMIDAVTARIIPALKQAATDVLDGLTITVTISRKPPVVESPK